MFKIKSLQWDTVAEKKAFVAKIEGYLFNLVAWSAHGAELGNGDSYEDGELVFVRERFDHALDKPVVDSLLVEYVII